MRAGAYEAHEAPDLPNTVQEVENSDNTAPDYFWYVCTEEYI